MNTLYLDKCPKITDVKLSYMLASKTIPSRSDKIKDDLNSFSKAYSSKSRSKNFDRRSLVHV